MIARRVQCEGAIIFIMRKRSELFFSVIFVPLDFLALLAAFVLAYIIRVKLEGQAGGASGAGHEFLQIILILLPVWILIFALSGLYSQSNLRGRLDEIGKVFVAVSGGVMFSILLDFLQPVSLFPSKAVPIYAYGFGLLFVLMSRRWCGYSALACLTLASGCITRSSLVAAKSRSGSP
jgi:hypothetical protein